MEFSDPRVMILTLVDSIVYMFMIQVLCYISRNVNTSYFDPALLITLSKVNISMSPQDFYHKQRYVAQQRNSFDIEIKT